MDETKKRKTNYGKSNPISFRLNADEHKTLERLVKKLKVSQSRVLSLALAHFNQTINAR